MNSTESPYLSRQRRRTCLGLSTGASSVVRAPQAAGATVSPRSCLVPWRNSFRSNARLQYTTDFFMQFIRVWLPARLSFNEPLLEQ